MPSTQHRPGREEPVTYCLAMRLTDGLIFLSDTRTNAGVDNVSTYTKLFVFHPAADRTIVIQSAGNLATTQEVMDRIDRDLANPGSPASLATGEHLFDLALYLGRVSVEVAESHRAALSASGADGTSTFLIGVRSPTRHPTSCSSIPGQLHPGLRRAALPSDRRDQVREVPA